MVCIAKIRNRPVLFYCQLKKLYLCPMKEPLSVATYDTTHAHTLYKDFAAFLQEHFDTKVQKISINAGFTCPNRDGRVLRGGCTYCNNASFNPDYCKPEKSIATQLREGMDFFARKYPQMKYLAYFQAYTNTYAPLEQIRRLYEEALSVDGVVGLVIGTRPDCVPNEVLDYLSTLSQQTFLMVEYGLESMNNDVLAHIRRGHTVECSIDALWRTKERGILTGAHLILGLPGETKEALVAQAKQVAQLPIDTLKLHQLQLIKGTEMAHDYRRYPDKYHFFTIEEYIDLICRYIEQLPPEMTLERFTSSSPVHLQVLPGWGLKNYQFVELLKSELRKRQTYQGRLQG